MKTRTAIRIQKRVAYGAAIYPRHILRAACRQLDYASIPIGGSDYGIKFYQDGFITMDPTCGTWIPGMIEDVVRICREIGVICKFEANHTFSVILPTDTIKSAVDRWHNNLNLSVEFLDAQKRFYREDDVDENQIPH